MLRNYQTEAIAAVAASWSNGTRRPAAQLATGLGKTVIFAELSRLMAQQAGRKPLVLVHRDELVRQSVDKLRAADPAMRVGIIQGGSLDITRTDAVVASVQTLVRRLGQIDPRRFDLLIVDECHHAAADSYRKILDHFGAFDPTSRTLSLGVTATMARGDGKGLGAVWDDVVFERDIRFGVENGFLVPAEVRTVRVAGLDTDRVRTGVDGDLAPGALARAMSKAHAGPAVARAYAEFARKPEGGYRRGIVFASTVETAQSWSADFWALGVRAAVVTGATSTEARQVIYADLVAGRLDVIASVMVLTEGFDLPAVEVAVIGRPTKSMALLTQMVGRVLRPSPATGKRAALVIDVVGSMGGGLARSFDLSIPTPSEPIAPDEDAVYGVEALSGPDTDQEVPEHEWVALDLHGAPLTAQARRAGYVAPEWLRTYAGTLFLPPTVEFPELIYIRGGEFWRKARGAEPEPLKVADGADVRDLHPGVKPIPGFVKATEKQVCYLSRLGLAADRASEANDLLSVHLASKELDHG